MKVGYYVRIDGYISKIGHIKTSSSGKIYAQWKQPNGLLASGNINIIEKSSPNIIDLIEAGDYVNGEKVIRLFNPMFLSMGELPYVITDKNNYEPQEINSIVTREQFESMEYRL